jgi:4-amino-4-deoxy-L-arabinose transferase-like glycosyltransferase
MSSPRKLDWLVAAALTLFAFVVRLPFCTDALHFSDSADYLRAARLGFRVNYTGGVGLRDMVKAYRSDPEFPRHPWAVLMAQGDVGALRHFHVPLAYYPHAVLAQLGGSDRSHRFVVAAISSLFVAVAFLVLRASRVSLALAGAGTLVLATNPAFLLMSREISPHPLFLVLAALCLYSLGAFPHAPRKYGPLALLAFGAAAATLELSLLLFLAAVIAAALQAGYRQAASTLSSTRYALAGAALFLAWLTLLWPAGVFKAGYLISYGSYVFFALFRRSEYYKDASVSELLSRLGSGNEIVGALFFLASLAILAWSLRSRKSPFALAFSIYSMLTLGQGWLTNFRNPTYVAEFVCVLWFPVLFALQGAVVRTGSPSRAWTLQLAAFVALGLLLAQHLRFIRSYRDPEIALSARVRAAIQILRNRYAPGTVFVVNRHHEVLGAYASEFLFEPGVWRGGLVPRLATRGGFVVLVHADSLSPQQRALLGPLCELGDTGFAVTCTPAAPRAAPNATGSYEAGVLVPSFAQPTANRFETQQEAWAFPCKSIQVRCHSCGTGLDGWGPLGVPGHLPLRPLWSEPLERARYHS